MDKLWRTLAWIMPKKLVYWCSIRLGSHVTTSYEHREVVAPDLTLLAALQQWERDYGL
jgi:hypothetical protein